MPTGKLTLEDVRIEVGHTLVMWLYSGTYQLHQADTTPSQRLETASSLYSLARKFDLYGLEILAREQITQLSSQIDVFTVIDAIEEAYPCTIGEDEWLESFITQQMEGALHGASCTPLPEPDTRADIPVSRLAFRALLKAFSGAIKDVSMAREGTPALAPGEVSCDDTNPRIKTGDSGLPADPKKKHTTPEEVEGPDGELVGENFLNDHATILPKQRASTELSTPLPDDDWDISIPRPEAEPAPAFEPEPLPEPEPEPMKEPESEPVPEPALEDDFWGVQRKKGARAVEVEPQPASEPVPEPAFEDSC